MFYCIPITAEDAIKLSHVGNQHNWWVAGDPTRYKFFVRNYYLACAESRLGKAEVKTNMIISEAGEPSFPRYSNSTACTLKPSDAS